MVPKCNIFETGHPLGAGLSTRVIHFTSSIYKQNLPRSLYVKRLEINKASNLTILLQEHRYRKQIARQLRTEDVEGI